MYLRLNINKLAETNISMDTDTLILEVESEPHNANKTININGLLPLHLKKLYFEPSNGLYGVKFFELDFLPEGLEKLDIKKFAGNFTFEEFANLPNSLKELDIFTITQLPQSLPKGLKKFGLYKCPLDFHSILPEDLEELSMYINYHRWDNKLPPRLKSLTLFDENVGFGYDPSFCLFLSLSEIITLPKTLKELTVYALGKENDEIYQVSFPPTLEKLTCQICNFRLKENTLPPTLKYLNVTEFNHKLLPDVLPFGLETFKTSGKNVKLRVKGKHIVPSSVKYLSYENNNESVIGKYDLHEGLEILKCCYLKRDKHIVFPSTLHTIKYVPNEFYSSEPVIDMRNLDEVNTYFPKHITNIYFRNEKIR